jgi:uncharacterized protein YjiS (DUF1127 family)
MSTIDTIGGRGRVSRETLGAKLTRLATAIVEKLAAMGDRHRTRRLLLEMSDAQLKDIGISRADAYREGSRPFWD